MNERTEAGSSAIGYADLTAANPDKVSDLFHAILRMNENAGEWEECYCHDGCWNLEIDGPCCYCELLQATQAAGISGSNSMTHDELNEKSAEIARQAEGGLTPEGGGGMRTIWKFSLDSLNRSTLNMPSTAKILCAKLQRGIIVLWAEIHTESHGVELPRTFRVFATGEPMPARHLHYIDTVPIDELVWHVYEEAGP